MIRIANVDDLKTGESACFDPSIVDSAIGHQWRHASSGRLCPS